MRGPDFDPDEPVLARLPWTGNSPWEAPPTWGYPKVRVPGGPTPDDALPCSGRWELFDLDVATTEARRLCGGCAFSDWCLQSALANNETGIWAGLSFDERKLISTEGEVSARVALKKKGRKAA